MYSIIKTSVRSGVSYNAIHASPRKLLHSSSTRHAISKFSMPAMSPTMTEGGIASWKKKEGESFTAGDILLEIETDKATIDVEAQDDGILGKIITPDGTKNIPVGKVIALLAEEGDDISNLEIPKEQSSPPEKEQKSSPEKSESMPVQDTYVPSPPSSSTPKVTHSAHEIKHSRPLFPSVLRLLLENNINDTGKIKGTGVRGMLTKGDVLAYLGKASSPTGTYKEEKQATQEQPKKIVEEPLDAISIRKLIVSGLVQVSARGRAPAPTPIDSLTFNSIISDYLPRKPSVPSTNIAISPPIKTKTSSTEDYFKGLL